MILSLSVLSPTWKKKNDDFEARVERVFYSTICQSCNLKSLIWMDSNNGVLAC